MKMSLVVDDLLSDVAAVGELGDAEVAEVAARITAVLARSLPSRMLEVLSEAGAELGRALPQGHVDLRLSGDDLEYVYVDHDPVVPSERPENEVGELTARITLRLSEQLKARVEASATHQGLSVNAWVVRTLERGASVPALASLSNQNLGRVGSRLRGFGTS